MLTALALTCTAATALQAVAGLACTKHSYCS